jgi:DNA mismatch repair protein MutL
MKTKQDQEELGTQIIVEGSKFVSQDGGTAERALHWVKIFFNIPARRNFLKSDTVEVILSMSFNVSL